jgi:2-dehydropantoate 2-reductase
MQIAVFGVGGVGGYFGGRLAQVGEEVIFIARGEHLKAIRRGGLRIESIKGNFTIFPIQAADDPKCLGPVDFVLLGVKAWQVPAAAEALRPLLSPQTCVIPLQNGVDAPIQLAEILGKEHVLGGLCRISAYKAEPGLIRHVGIEPKILFAELDGSFSERVAILRAAFERAEVSVETPKDIQAALWRKFLFIAAVSGVGAVARVPIGVTRSLPATRQMLIQAMQEIAELARNRQIELESDIVVKTLASIDAMAPAIVPSMQRDIQDGRPSELESQNGAVVRMGIESGIATPLHAFIYASLLPQELQARSENPLALS